MRTWLLALAGLLFGLLAPHAVQGAVAAAQTTDQSGQSVSGADTLGVMFLESGALTRIADSAFQRSGQEIWDGWSAQPGFNNLPTEKRDEVRQYLISDYPREAAQDVILYAPETMQSFGPRMEELMSAQQRAETVGFFRSTAGRSWFVNTASAGDEATVYLPSDAETRALAEFMATSAGEIFNSGEMSRLILDASEQVIVARASAIQRRVFLRVCELLEEHCPPEFAALQ